MTPEDEKKIRQWYQQLDGEVRIAVRLTEDDRTREIEAFCNELVRLAPGLEVMREKGDPEDLPAIDIGDRAVLYHAVPSGTKLSPFLQGLLLLGRERTAQREPLFEAYKDVSERLKAMEVPAFLRLFVAPNCPFCPVVTEQVMSLAVASSLVHLSVIDGMLFPEVAESEGIRSAPAVLLDDHFRWTGHLNMSEVLEAMMERDPAGLSSDVLESMLKAGNGSKLIEMMLDREVVFPGLIDLLTHEKIFVRVGAMMVMEEIAKRRKDIAAQVTEALWRRFFEAKDQVKGDIIHVLGEIGDEGLLPRMKEVLNGDYHEEVKDAARDATEKISRAAGE